MKKRAVSGFLALTMLGSLVVGCQKDTGANTSSGAAAPVPDYDSGELYAQAKFSEEPIYPTYMLRTNETFTEETLAYQWIGEITNIYFKPIPVPLASYDEKLSALIASGDIPDYQALRSSTVAKQYGPNGVFVNLSERIESGQMPNLKQRLDEGPDDAYVVLKAPDGQIYGAPRIYTYDMLHETFMMRTDLMKEWGYPERFETFDELHEFLKECKEKYPDSTPLGSRWGVQHAFNGFGEMFDGLIDLAYLDPIDKTTWKMGPFTDGFEEMITYMNTLYSEGILDPEWTTCSDEQWKERILNDKFMLTYDYMSSCDELESSGKTRNPSFEFRPVIPPAAGGRMKMGVADTSHRIYQCLKAISTKSKYVEELVRFTDWTYSKEGSDVLNYGKAGETFTYDANGKVVLDADVKTIHNLNGSVDLGKIGVAAEWTSIEPEEMEQLKNLGPNTIAAQKKFREEGAVLASQPSLTFDEETLARKNDLSGPLTTYRDEMMVRFTTGDEPLSNFDKFRETLKSMGIEELLEIYKKTYDQQMAMK